jgi:hypothetical protein
MDTLDFAPIDLELWKKPQYLERLVGSIDALLNPESLVDNQSGIAEF